LAQLIPNMTILQFSDSPDAKHQVQVRAQAVFVDGVCVEVRKHAQAGFICTQNGRTERLLAVSHGDTIYVQLRGRSVRLQRVDPTRAARSGTSAGGGGGGASLAPMPGVVVALLVAAGQQVKKGDALLVIESMKMQMTISSELDGSVKELPLAVGQTFQRSDILALVITNGDAL